MPCGENSTGELGFEELLALLTLCNLLDTNDSGPLHLDTLMQTPTVSLLGTRRTGHVRHPRGVRYT